MPKDEITSLAAAFGWLDLGPQKNKSMISFKREEYDGWRMNVYFTTMTVTLQHEDGRRTSYREVDSGKFEEILQSV